MSPHGPIATNRCHGCQQSLQGNSRHSQGQSPLSRLQLAYFAAVCGSILSARAIEYVVSPLAARRAICWRNSIPSLGLPIFTPLARALAMPAFVRSLIFWASSFANEDSNASWIF